MSNYGSTKEHQAQGTKRSVGVKYRPRLSPSPHNLINHFISKRSTDKAFIIVPI